MGRAYIPKKTVICLTVQEVADDTGFARAYSSHVLRP
jgi:hypothetical protein